MRTSTIQVMITAAVLGILLSAPSAKAQDYVPTPVTISTNKIKVDGKLCYSHIVLERQTIYSICKAYNVSEEDLYKFNPGLEENGLKKNGIIIIPSQEAIESAAKESAKEAAKEAAKETAKEPVKEPVQQEGVRKHVTKWYECLSVIAEKYGVSAESIIRLNNLKDTILTNRQKLLIPSQESSAALVANTEPQEQPAAEEEKNDSTITEKAAAPEFKPKEDVRFGLILPMGATGSTSKRNYMDFYSGVLLAVYDASNKGIGTDLRVFDNAEGNMPEDDIMEGCDFIIGPVYKKSLAAMLAQNRDGAMIVSPLDQRAAELVGNNTCLIQAPTLRVNQYEDLVAWIKEDMRPQDKVIYISETNTRDTLAVKQMKACLDGSGLSYEKFSYNILQGRDISNPLLAKMTKEGTNRFIIESESEAWVNDVVRNINLLKKENDVVLYSPSKIRTFETIEAEYFHNVSLHVSLSYNIDFESDAVKKFIMKYRALYRTEPTQFAYQGYDISTYFISLASRYGDDWKEKLTESPEDLLQMTFRFRREPEGGYINTGVRRVEYRPDGSVINIE